MTIAAIHKPIGQRVLSLARFAMTSAKRAISVRYSALHGFHALLEDGELPGKFVSVRRVARGTKLRAAGLPSQKLVEVVLLVTSEDFSFYGSSSLGH